jgi:hydroxysqualene synthase
VSVDHYENFPVASVLCPPALRPPITAIYHFARTADDIADEGHAPAAERLAALADYRRELLAVARGQAPGPRWARVFTPLARQMQQHALPVPLLTDLLDAFAQDAGNPPYPDRAALLDYCRRSADPIGRLLLHLYGIDDPAALRRSDAICSALQLINFWQDLSVDGPRGRHYVPVADRVRHGVPLADLAGCRDSPAARDLIRELSTWAHGLMQEGAPLVHRVPGRAGWELRLVVQGGLRILEKIAAMDHATLLQRPTIGTADAPLLLWRALRMKARP